MKYNWGNMLDDWEYSRCNDNGYARKFTSGKETIEVPIKEMQEMVKGKTVDRRYNWLLPDWIASVDEDAYMALAKYVCKRETIFQKRQEIEAIAKKYWSELEAFETMIKNGVIEE